MNEILIGREKEISTLTDIWESPRSEFLAVYGRWRIGKTFLIQSFFEKKDGIFFKQTGLHNASLQEQLTVFGQSLATAFYQGAEIATPKNWMGALRQLTTAINNAPINKKIIVFFDELPWLATRRSGFLRALEYYWNSDWCYRQQLILIVCGSAASWMIEKLIYAKGGFHNRITFTIPLQPFTLRETAFYLSSMGKNFSEQQILQLYMVTGGVPHYLRAIKNGLSAPQNIDRLCFQQDGLLFNEFEKLFGSLYEDAADHIKIVRIMARTTGGLSREQLIASLKKLSSGGRLNQKIKNLEESGFISTFIPLGHAKRGIHYRVIDEYVLFYLNWIEPLRKKSRKEARDDRQYWLSQINTPAYHAWSGYAFEAICFKHIGAIKKVLGIEQIPCGYGDWRYTPVNKQDQGAQIDLLFDRDDGCLTLCEIKNTLQPFLVTKEYAKLIEIKKQIYSSRNPTTKHILMALISNNGVVKNAEYKKTFSNLVTGKDLFT